MNPYYADESVTLYHGDCLEVLATLPDASVDAVVTDPPLTIVLTAVLGAHKGCTAQTCTTLAAIEAVAG